MPENYKSYILIGIAFLVGVFFTIFIIKPSLTNREVSQSSPQAPNTPSVQLTDTNFMEVTPVEKLGVDTSDPQALARLGDQYFESNYFNQAIELYKKTLEINPNDIAGISENLAESWICSHVSRQERGSYFNIAKNSGNGP
jgi:tetratricopeptide (TPR) repeat protein